MLYKARLVDWDDDELPGTLWCPKVICTSKCDNFTPAPDGVHLLDAARGRLKRGYNFDGYVMNPMENMLAFPFDCDALDVRFYTESNWESPDGEGIYLPHGTYTYCVRTHTHTHTLSLSHTTATTCALLCERSECEVLRVYMCMHVCVYSNMYVIV